MACVHGRSRCHTTISPTTSRPANRKLAPPIHQRARFIQIAYAEIHAAAKTRTFRYRNETLASPASSTRLHRKQWQDHFWRNVGTRNADTEGLNRAKQKRGHSRRAVRWNQGHPEKRENRKCQFFTAKLANLTSTVRILAERAYSPRSKSEPSANERYCPRRFHTYYRIARHRVR